MTITQAYEYENGEGARSATPRFYEPPLKKKKARYQYD